VWNCSRGHEQAPGRLFFYRLITVANIRGAPFLVGPNQKFSAEYTTQRNGGLTYSYEATWARAGTRIIWSAIVTRNGEFKGQPNGTIQNAMELDPVPAVKALVEHSIENLFQVEK
jgi:hypothetical protein